MIKLAQTVRRISQGTCWIHLHSNPAGLSVELFYMHKETYDVSGTKICQLDRAAAPTESKEPSICSDVVGESEKGVSHEALPIRDDGDVQAAETIPQDQDHQDEEVATCSRTTESDVLVARRKSFDGIDAMEVDEGRAEGDNAACHSVVSELDMQVPIDSVPEDRCNVLENLATEANSVEKAGSAGAPHLSPEHMLNEQSSGKDYSEANVLLEGVNAISELRAHAVAEAEPPSGIGGSVDAETNFPTVECIAPIDHGDITSGTAMKAPDEHGNLIFGENNEDAGRFRSSSSEALDKGDTQISSVLKDKFGHTVEREVDLIYESLIDDEGACLHQDLEGRDTETIDGHNVSYRANFSFSILRAFFFKNSFIEQLNLILVPFIFLLGLSLL